MTEPEVVRLYKQTKSGTRSRELLEILPGGRAKAMLPEELGRVMKPNGSGNPLSKGSVRGAMRVVQRVTTKLTKRGSIGGNILQVDFSGYGEEGAGRYFIDEPARQALDEHLSQQTP